MNTAFNLGLIFFALTSLANGAQLELQLDPRHVDPAKECELALAPDFHFEVERVPNHNVFLIRRFDAIEKDIVTQLRNELRTESLEPFTDRALKIGFIDFYFEGFAGAGSFERMNAGTLFPLKDHISPKLYAKLEGFIVPRYKAGYSVVPHHQIDKGRSLLLRLYISDTNLQSRWHRDGKIRMSSRSQDGVMEEQNKIVMQAWTFAHTFDQPDTIFRDLPNFKTSFETSVVFDGATEEHRATNDKGRLVILGAYYVN